MPVHLAEAKHSPEPLQPLAQRDRVTLPRDRPQGCPTALDTPSRRRAQDLSEVLRLPISKDAISIRKLADGSNRALAVSGKNTEVLQCARFFLDLGSRCLRILRDLRECIVQAEVSMKTVLFYGDKNPRRQGMKTVWCRAWFHNGNPALRQSGRRPMTMCPVRATHCHSIKQTKTRKKQCL